MAEQATLDRLKERRLDRMRQGQAVAERYPIPSDPEVHFLMVPLLESEYEMALQVASQIPASDNVPGMELRERIQSKEILAFSIREPSDLSKRVFENGNQIGEFMEIQDINFLMDMYLEMVDQTSPSLDGIPEQELENLKKVLQEISWSELSGKQWYAAKRFLLSIFPDLLTDRLLGFSSTNNAITTSDKLDSVTSAENEND